MRKPAYRVIIDRSAFHGDRFDAIRSSPLRDLQKRGDITVYLTPILLEETLSAYGAGPRAQQWHQHLLFCVEVCNDVFLDRNDIWHNELVACRGPFARHFMPDRPSRRYDSRPRLLETLREKATSGDLSEEWAESEPQRKETQTKKSNQRTISGEIRQTIADALKGRRVSGSAKDFPFSKFKAKEFIRTGRQLVDLVQRKRTGVLADLWVLEPARYPFFSAFVEGFLYAGYYAAAELNRPLDRNAQLDYELLCYLTWADLVVSDDMGFLSNAFDAMWRPRGKRLESSQSFVQLLEQLA